MFGAIKENKNIVRHESYNPNSSLPGKQIVGKSVFHETSDRRFLHEVVPVAHPQLDSTEEYDHIPTVTVGFQNNGEPADKPSRAPTQSGTIFPKPTRNNRQNKQSTSATRHNFSKPNAQQPTNQAEHQRNRAQFFQTQRATTDKTSRAPAQSGTIFRNPTRNSRQAEQSTSAIGHNFSKPNAQQPTNQAEHQRNRAQFFQSRRATTDKTSRAPAQSGTIFRNPTRNTLTLLNGTQTMHPLGGCVSLWEREYVPSYEWAAEQCPSPTRFAKAMVTQLSVTHLNDDPSAFVRLLESYTGIFIHSFEVTSACFRVNTLDDDIMHVLYDGQTADHLWTKKQRSYELRMITPRIARLTAKTVLKDVEKTLTDLERQRVPPNEAVQVVPVTIPPFPGDPQKRSVIKSCALLSVTIDEDMLSEFKRRVNGQILQDVDGAFWVAENEEQSNYLASYSETLKHSDWLRKANLPSSLVRVEVADGMSPKNGWRH